MSKKISRANSIKQIEKIVMEDKEIVLLKQHSDYKYLRENLSDIELLTMESILEHCELIDNRPADFWEQNSIGDFPYGNINGVPMFDVKCDEDFAHIINSSAIKNILLWYESLEEIDYIIDIVRDITNSFEKSSE